MACSSPCLMTPEGIQERHFFLRDGHGREKTRDENDEGRGRILTFDGSSISTILPC